MLRFVSDEAEQFCDDVNDQLRRQDEGVTESVRRLEYRPTSGHCWSTRPGVHTADKTSTTRQRLQRMVVAPASRNAEFTTTARVAVEDVSVIPTADSAASDLVGYCVLVCH